VSHLAGKSDNQNTILNFFVQHICKGINFDLWRNATRNLIDIDDMYTIANHILQNQLFSNQITNIASPFNYSVDKIVATIEKYSGVKANYTSINKGVAFKIDISAIKSIIQNLQIEFGEDYLDKMIMKYYKPELVKQI
jgi:nucleoside-diphosphate-sugar epimerase